MHPCNFKFTFLCYNGKFRMHDLVLIKTSGDHFFDEAYHVIFYLFFQNNSVSAQSKVWINVLTYQSTFLRIRITGRIKISQIV